MTRQLFPETTRMFVRRIVIIGLIVIAIAYAIWIILTFTPIRDMLMMSVGSGAQEDIDSSSSFGTAGTVIDTLGSPWTVPLGLAGGVMTGALVFGIVTAALSRVSIAAGLTRAATLRENLVFLGAVVLTLVALYVVAVLPALIIDPAPAVTAGSLHPLVSILAVALQCIMGALLGHLIGIVFVCFPWYVGVAGSLVAVSIPSLTSEFAPLAPVPSLVLTVVGSVLVAVLAAIGSRVVIGRLQLT